MSGARLAAVSREVWSVAQAAKAAFASVATESLRPPPRPGTLWLSSAMAANTGQSLGAVQWTERADAQDVLVAQTARLAAVLERNGIPTKQGQRAELDDDGNVVRLIMNAPMPVTAIGDVTGATDEVSEPYRAIRFLPSIAQRDRRPILTALRYYQRHDDGGRYIRLAVVTSGARVPLMGDLKARHREHTKSISRWASEAKRDYGVEVLLRSTEYTCTGDGIHLHSNLLYRPDHAIPKARWRAFLRWSRRRLGGVVWKDCGRLRKPDEAIKYCYKPGELERQPDAVVCWLYGEHERTKLVQPMGGFAAFLRELETHREKVVMVNKGSGQGAVLRKVEKAERIQATSAPAGDGPGENILLCRTLPQARFTPWAEPVSLVGNYTPNPTTPDGWRRLAVLNVRRDEAEAWWRANRAPDADIALLAAMGRRAAQAGREGDVLPFRRTPATDARQGGLFKVHTGTPSAQTAPDLEGAHPPPKTPRRVGTEADGALFDRDTGEILYEPETARAELRERTHAANLAAYDGAAYEVRFAIPLPPIARPRPAKAKAFPVRSAPVQAAPVRSPPRGTERDEEIPW